jgi:glycyl-tRNA synthetase alpha chain
MYIQGVDSVYDLVWSVGPDGHTFTYGDVFLRNEQQYSAYNFEVADVDMLLGLFSTYEAECKRTLEAGYVLPAYDYVLKCSHAFIMLDARGAISVTERQGYILRVRALAKACCAAYIDLISPAEEEAPDASAEGGEVR